MDSKSVRIACGRDYPVDMIAAHFQSLTIRHVSYHLQEWSCDELLPRCMRYRREWDNLVVIVWWWKRRNSYYSVESFSSLYAEKRHEDSNGSLCYLCRITVGSRPKLTGSPTYHSHVRKNKPHRVAYEETSSHRFRAHLCKATGGAVCSRRQSVAAVRDQICKQIQEVPSATVIADACPGQSESQMLSQKWESPFSGTGLADICRTPRRRESNVTEGSSNPPPREHTKNSTVLLLFSFGVSCLGDSSAELLMMPVHIASNASSLRPGCVNKSWSVRTFVTLSRSGPLRTIKIVYSGFSPPNTDAV
ncbi:hypothetical protein F5J12DRAFT_784443 [Pisolithus orientalis]|uniref:uncharacterized protein n=1 Tax=Pisolithus orientalis TaxID=936130 RepID=UPI0022255241|nr:uncharacterized protein F5J12DRAFT_784443 [Pisolithus orientalis]KAI6000129.1 hypothetical protein F5J12DRAFT_784443 [Pisolithus orientalis]